MMANSSTSSLSPHVGLLSDWQSIGPSLTCTKVGFYKSLGRPIAKVFFGAVFTYQVVYWLWVKLETDEIRDRKTSMCLYWYLLIFVPIYKSIIEEISSLEAKVRALRKN